MPYIGNTPAEKYAAFDVQYFTTSATASYTLDHAVANELDIRLVINNVIQEPGSGKAYTASGTTLTLSAATAGTDTMYCVYTAKASQTVNPPAGSVGTSQLADDAVNSAKLSSTAVDNTNTNSTLITAQTAKTSLVDADKFLISDSAASGALKYVEKQYLPSSTLVKIATVNQVGDASFVELQNCFNSTYQSYLVVIRRFTPSTSGEGLRMRLMTSTNTPVNSSSYRYASRYFDQDGSSSSNTGNNQSSWVIANPVGSAEANGGASSSMWFNVGTNNNSDSAGRFNGTISFSDGNGKQLSGYIGGYYNTSYGSTASTGLEWFATNGNVARLQATCYGVIL